MQNCHTLEDLGHSTAMGISTKHLFAGAFFISPPLKHVYNRVHSLCLHAFIHGVFRCGGVQNDWWPFVACAFMETTLIAALWRHTRPLPSFGGILHKEAFSIMRPCVHALHSCGGIPKNAYAFLWGFFL